jgi:hypothetical protein
LRNVTTGAGLRPGAKATDKPPDPTVRALNFYPDNRTHGSTGGAGEADAHGETEHAPEGKPDGLSPSDLPATDQPAAYLTHRISSELPEAQPEPLTSSTLWPPFEILGRYEAERLVQAASGAT